MKHSPLDATSHSPSQELPLPSLPCLQELATGPSLEPDVSRSHPHDLFL